MQPSQPTRAPPDAKLRALALFNDIADLQPGQRTHALAGLRAQDEALHDALVSLLAADVAEYPLDTPPFELLAVHGAAGDAGEGAPDARPGTRLGPWEVEALLQTGGMGSVYLAHRADGHYEQRVVLKCIRAELSSPALIKAFHNERSILAQLEHPHVSALLDGGVEADGHPWFAMRYVDGLSIDHWCDKRNATLRQRVALLIQICDALAYVHGQRVLHQDIKPSNLLVTAHGQVQLVDFGLSAVLAHDDGAETPRIAISNGYAAPETLAGAPPSVEMDIHAVGVVVYRLLCGEWPRPLTLGHARLHDGAPREPEPMSALASQAPSTAAHSRGYRHTKGLARALSGDLDAIALKCVASDPAQRYASAGELRDDLQRWLDFRPVSARQGGARYRAGRFLRRQWLTTGLAALVVVALGIGFGVTAWKDHLDAREAEATQAMSRVFQSTLGAATVSGLSEIPYSTAKALISAEKQLRGDLFESHRALRVQGLSALARGHATIGQHGPAGALAREAATLAGGDPARSAQALATQAALLNLQGRHAEAKRMADKGIALPGNDGPAASGSRLLLLTERARADWGLADRDAALATLDQALASARTTAAADPEPLAELLTLRGSWRARLFRLTEAEKDLEQAIQVADRPNPLLAGNARLHLMRTLSLLEQRDRVPALAHEVLDSQRRLLGDEHPNAGQTWVILAESQFMHGRQEAATDSLSTGKAILHKAYGEQHPEYAEALRVTTILGPLLRKRRAENLRQSRQAASILERTLGPSHERTVRGKTLLANVLITVPDRFPLPQRRAWQDEGIALFENMLMLGRKEHIPMPYQKLFLARALNERSLGDDLQRAESLLRECLAEADVYFGPHHGYRLTSEFALAALLFKTAHYDEAEQSLTNVIESATASLPKRTATLAVYDAHVLRAFSALRQGKTAHVAPDLQRAEEHVLAFFGPDHPTMGEVRKYRDELARTGSIRDASLPQKDSFTRRCRCS